MKDVKQAALEHFAAGSNCAEAVLQAVAQATGAAHPDLAGLATGFGAGVGRCGEICGALSGAVMALGLHYGAGRPADVRAKELIYAKADELIQAFQEEFGNIRCLSLTGCNMRTPEGMQQARDLDLHHTLCPKFVAFAAELAQGMIQDEAGDKE